MLYTLENWKMILSNVFQVSQWNKERELHRILVFDCEIVYIIVLYFSFHFHREHRENNANKITQVWNFYAALWCCDCAMLHNLVWFRIFSSICAQQAIIRNTIFFWNETRSLFSKMWGLHDIEYSWAYSMLSCMLS